MTRNDHIRQYFSKEMRLIEIGPSYNPIVPKADGWNTVVVDYADRAILLEKYRTIAADPAIIEEVDVVWRDGSLSDAVPAAMHGTFDGMISSHSAEHMPDLIGFLQAASKLLKSTGMFFLALPDKRLCFDFFQPHSTTGDVIDGMGRERHSIGCLWDHAAYYTQRGENTTWGLGGEVVPFRLVHPLTVTKDILNINTNAEYIDAHKWRFTPASFQLLIFELNLLGLIPWSIGKIEPAPFVEFYVVLERRMIVLTQERVEETRLRLLQEIMMETKTQVAMLEAPVAPIMVESPAEIRPAEKPITMTISAVIPLYNGARFIHESVMSILAQSLPPNEIIVVDDGSTDNGPALVQELAKQYPMITLLTKENGGQSSARNYGIAHSTGDLIALLDQDDVWYRDHLSQLIQPFLENSAGRELGWVYSNLDEMDTDGNMVGHDFLRSHATPHPKRDMFECLREDMFILPSASLILRKAFDAIGGFDENLSGYEDDDLFLRLFRAGYGNVFLETALSKWRIYPESSSYSYRMRRSRAIYFRKLWETYQDDPSRARWIKRDLLIPRFYMHALAEYLKAVNSRQPPSVINETRSELQYIVTRMPGWKRRVFGQMLSRLESQRLTNAAFRLRRYARPIYRRLL